MDSDSLASHIDHTVLKPDARRADISMPANWPASSAAQESVSTRSTLPSQVSCSKDRRSCRCLAEIVLFRPSIRGAFALPRRHVILWPSAGARFRHRADSIRSAGVPATELSSRRLTSAEFIPLFIAISAEVPTSRIWSLMEPWETKADHRASLTAPLAARLDAANDMREEPLWPSIPSSIRSRLPAFRRCTFRRSSSVRTSFGAARCPT